MHFTLWIARFLIFILMKLKRSLHRDTFYKKIVMWRVQVCKHCIHFASINKQHISDTHLLHFFAEHFVKKRDIDKPLHCSRCNLLKNEPSYKLLRKNFKVFPITGLVGTLNISLGSVCLHCGKGTISTSHLRNLNNSKIFLLLIVWLIAPSHMCALS